MRWDRLFDDLEAQLAAAERLDVASDAAERTRGERAEVDLAHRLLAHLDQPLGLRLVGGGLVRGRCRDVAPGWVVLVEHGTSVLVPVRAVVSVEGLGPRVSPEAGSVLRRLGLGHALRALARDRAPVRVATTGGELTGTVDRVGADHVDLAEHVLGEPRRPASVRGVVAVPFVALVTVRSTA